MTTFLLRHASTSYSTRYLVNGDPAVALPLNEEGAAACDRLRGTSPLGDAQVWITSDFQRTRQTARLLTRPAKITLHSDPRLNELDYGDFEGGPFLDYAAWLGRHGPWARPPGSAESQREAFRRMLTGVQEALDHPGPRAIVAHGLLLSLLTWALTEPPGTAIPLFFPEAACLDPLVIADARLHALTGRLIDDLNRNGTSAQPKGGDRTRSGQEGTLILANFDPLPTPPEERPPHA